jgi:hypothetical protein
LVGYRGDGEALIESAGILSGFMRQLLEKLGRLGIGWHTSVDALIEAQLKGWYGDDIPDYAEEEYGWIIDKIRETFPDDGWTITTGSASYNQGDGMEMMIGNGNIALNSDVLKLETWV